MIAIVQTKGEEQKAAIETAMECLTTLEGAFKTVPKEPPFFGGATVGYVDIILGPVASWFPAFEAVGDFKIPFQEKFPCLHAWLKAFQESSVGACLPDSHKVTEFVVQVLRKMFMPDS